MVVFLLGAWGCAGPEKAPPDSPTADTNDTIHSVPPDTGGETDTVPPDPDGDGDGWVEPEDCDDADANVHPGADEVPYDGIDQDCDGVDADDLDGDGYGAADDCDDADVARSPGVLEEPANTIDDDCDGYVDLDAYSIDDAGATLYGERGDATGNIGLGSGMLEQGTDLDGDGVGELVMAGQGFSIAATVGLGGTVENADLWSVVELDLDTLTSPPALERVAGVPTGRVAVLIEQVPTGCPVEDGIGILDLQEIADAASIDCTTPALHVEFPHGGRVFFDKGWMEWSRDLDADGLADMPIVNQGGTQEAWVLLGADIPAYGILPESTMSIRLETDWSGFTNVWSVPDLDGDGYETLGVEVMHYDWDIYLVDGDGLASGNPLNMYSARIDDKLAETVTPMEPGDVDGDGAADLLLGVNLYGAGDPTLAGCHDSVELFTDLGSGGVHTVADSAGRMCVEDGGYDWMWSVTMGSLRGGALLDLAMGVNDGIYLMPAEDFPVGETRSVLDLPDRIDGRGAELARSRLLLADLDGDGDDDIAASNAMVDEGYVDPARTDPSGIVQVFFNPR